MTTATPSEPTRSGFIALIGAPNAGKSTLLNAMVGAKVAIVTHKVQTTRTRMMGIAMAGAAQLVFVDTPGIFKPKKRIERAMVSTAWRGAKDADLIALLVDASMGITDDVERILTGLKETKQKAFLILNKIDCVQKEKLLTLTNTLNETGLFPQTFMISALKGHGIQDLKAAFGAEMQEGPWFFPEDQITDVSYRNLAAEITREKIFLRLHQELPYSIWVATEKWDEQKDGSVRIEQVIHVERDSQKGIVIGKGGQTLKDIGAKSREELEKILDHRVHLFLFVKVSEKWTDSPFHYSEMGLDFVD